MRGASDRRQIGAWVSRIRGSGSENHAVSVWATRTAAARREGEASRISDVQARDIADNATAACVLARVGFLEASSCLAAAADLRRSAWRLGISRAEKLRLTFEGAREDPDFARTTLAADAARDGGRWAEAGRLYDQALQWYPLHHGYRVQYAHMCKEQGQFARAEIGYRDALNLGAPLPDVEPHLAFVAHIQDQPSHVPQRGGPLTGPMGDSPCVVDLRTLAYILWREQQLSEVDILTLLRSCPTCDTAAARMIEDDRFSTRNGPFLSLMYSRR